MICPKSPGFVENRTYSSSRKRYVTDERRRSPRIARVSRNNVTREGHREKS
jgi:hypothetical protein